MLLGAEWKPPPQEPASEPRRNAAMTACPRASFLWRRTRPNSGHGQQRRRVRLMVRGLKHGASPKQTAQRPLRHIQAVVKEMKPAQNERLRTIPFLAKTGHMRDLRRQDITWLMSCLGGCVRHGQQRLPSGASGPMGFGRFHCENAPTPPMGTNICPDGNSDPRRSRADPGCGRQTKANCDYQFLTGRQ